VLGKASHGFDLGQRFGVRRPRSGEEVPLRPIDRGDVVPAWLRVGLLHLFTAKSVLCPQPGCFGVLRVLLDADEAAALFDRRDRR